MPHGRSNPASSGSMPPTCLTPRQASAATRKAASDARAAVRACANISSRPGRKRQNCPCRESEPLPAPVPCPRRRCNPGLDRTVKMYIGGKRVTAGFGLLLSGNTGKNGRHLAEVGLGQPQGHPQCRRSRAYRASGWSGMTGHQRAQVLYFLAENLELRSAEFAARLADSGASAGQLRKREVEASVARIMHYAAWADKYDGAVRAPDKRMLTLALNEPWDVMGISCPDEAPLLGFVSLVLARHRDGQPGCGDTVAAPAAAGAGFLSGARHVRCARRCGQHRHR
jgi:hypothetical protein